MWWIFVASGSSSVYVDESVYVCVTSKGLLNLGINFTTWLSLACMYSHCLCAVARSMQLPTSNVGLGAWSLFTWRAWLIFAAVRESLASRMSLVN